MTRREFPGHSVGQLLQHGMPLADMVRNFFESQLQWPQRRQSMELSFQSAQRLSDLEEEQGRQLQGRVALGLKEQRQRLGPGARMPFSSGSARTMCWSGRGV